MTVDLFVQDEGQGTPVVLLHSSGLSGRQWRRLSTAVVARGLRAVVPDLTGHGRSPAWPEPTPFSYQLDVMRLGEVLAGLSEPAHLVGHSYGGLLALLAALAAPARVRSLALYDPVAMGALDPILDEGACRDLGRVDFGWDGSDAGRERWLQTFVEYWSGSSGWAALQDAARAEFRRVAWVVYEGARTLVRDRTPASAYAALECPVLLLAGAGSPLAAQRVAERLAGSLRDVRVETVPGAAHMGPLTHADVVNEQVLRAI